MQDTKNLSKEEFEKELEQYKQKFSQKSIEQKREDLSVHPMVNQDRINEATDEEIEEIYLILNSAMDMSMREVLGESMFDM
jgi:hypothetical protein